jgi:hypothetical protein
VALSSYKEYIQNKWSRHNLSVFVNLMTGNVFVSPSLEVPPRCAKVGGASCDTSFIDEQRYPSFQGVRGICTTIVFAGGVGILCVSLA